MDKLDPNLWFLRLVLRGFLKANLEEQEMAFVYDNIRKHRRALWVNLVASVFITLAILDSPPEAINTVISSLIAPVMLLGTAWFAISFGGVPKKLINVAMTTTWWMFSAFLASLSAMFIAVAFITSPWLWPVLGFVYLSVVIACVQYDTADGLKAGLDDAVLKHSRYAVQFYRREGIGEGEQ